MVGTAMHGELNAARTRDVHYAVATAADDAALRRLLRDNPMRGAISLSFEREPGYFRGMHLAGADDVTVIAREHGRLVCMGRCTTRLCWLNGAPHRVAYLGELRLDAAARGRFEILRRGYRFFHDVGRRAPADFTFTSISVDNTRARRFFERALPGMPRYEFLDEFVTLLVPVAQCSPARERRDSQGSRTGLHKATAAELVAVLNAHAQRHQLAAVWAEDRLAALAQHGLTPADFAVHRDRDGRLVAAAALWDQRNFRQTVIRGYSSALAWARPAVNLAARILHTPRLPRVGSVLAHAFVSPLALATSELDVLARLLAQLGQRAAQRGVEFLTLGFCSGDPRLARLRAEVAHRAYLSRIYRVRWPDDRAMTLDPRLILPEIAFL